MTALARAITLLLAAALGLCAFLPWFGDVEAVRIPIGSLLDAAANSGAQLVSSVGLLVIVAAGILAMSSVAASRILLIIGSLMALGVSAVWILVRLLDGVGATLIGPGAYGAAVCGLSGLLLAALATDTRVPTVR